MHPYNRALMVEANKRRREAIKLRDKGMTLEEIGKRFKISRQRVHQLIAAAHDRNLT